eukprot:Nk52_evm20s276 gene=Nk52_evmTU20s276
MFKKGFNSNRLKVQIKLAINRFKMLKNKRNNQQAIQRKEIAGLLDNGKDESARIKVEHIIRDDYLMEAMDVLELYCELLLARFGLIESMKYCDDGIIEAVATIIWASPRLQNDVRELAGIREQLLGKYGKEFGMDVMENKDDVVNERIMHKLSLQTPDQELVTQYLEVIAKSHNVNWAPPKAASPPPLPDLPTPNTAASPVPPEPYPASAASSSSSRPLPPPPGGSQPPQQPPAPKGFTYGAMPSYTPVDKAPQQAPPPAYNSANATLDDDDDDLDFDDLSKRFEALKSNK